MPYLMLPCLDIIRSFLTCDAHSMSPPPSGLSSRPFGQGRRFGGWLLPVRVNHDTVPDHSDMVCFRMLWPSVTAYILQLILLWILWDLAHFQCANYFLPWLAPEAFHGVTLQWLRGIVGSIWSPPSFPARLRRGWRSPPGIDDDRIRSRENGSIGFDNLPTALWITRWLWFFLQTTWSDYQNFYRSCPHPFDNQSRFFWNCPGAGHTISSSEDSFGGTGCLPLEICAFWRRWSLASDHDFISHRTLEAPVIPNTITGTEGPAVFDFPVSC